MTDGTGTTIFANTAPAYWEKGMSAMPLKVKSKIPVEYQWQKYSEEMPLEFTREWWLKRNADCNIGLVLGRASNVVIIDVDTNDPVTIAAIESCIPISPWRRVGKKGYAAAYRFNGTKTFRIKSLSGEMVVEHLSDRTQIVLPPSIHPETNRPYTANCDLFDVVDSLPTLPDGIEAILRGALETMANVELSSSG